MINFKAHFAEIQGTDNESFNNADFVSVGLRNILPGDTAVRRNIQ